MAKTLPVNGLSSGVVSDSLTTTGGSLTAVTVMIKSAVSEPPLLSEIVYPKDGTVPK